MKHHLNYGDKIFDKAYNNSFHQRRESYQSIASLAITGAIKGSSSEKLYQEPGLESLQNGWCHGFKTLRLLQNYKNSSQDI